MKWMLFLLFPALSFAQMLEIQPLGDRGIAVGLDLLRSRPSLGTRTNTAYEEALTLPAMTPDGDAADLPAVTSGNVVTTSRVSLVQWVQENPGKTASAVATLAAAAYLAYDYGKKDSGDTKVVPDPQVQEADTVVSIRGDNNTVTVDRSDNSQANTSTEAAGMP